MTGDSLVPGSFRDPSGFVFSDKGLIYRQINRCYHDSYRQLIDSGLYQDLVGRGLLVAHEELDQRLPSEPGFLVILPEQLPFVSYPYEWCFSQLKAAALATLEVQKLALGKSMSLKDASAFNIQFPRGRPVLIDTLSFEKYREGSPWVAYGQFCRHFLAPLALMSCCDFRLGQLLRVHIDGIPLDLTSSLLPRSTKLRFGLLTHIHMHAKSQKNYQDRKIDRTRRAVPLRSMLGLIDNLENTVKKLRWRPTETEWGDCYNDTKYSQKALDHKRQLVREYAELSSPQSIWDMGANDGMFSRLAGGDRPTISFDLDPVAVEKNFARCQTDSDPNVLPLVLDLSNPSPGLGWAGRERMSLMDRGEADLVLALALVHHLAISNNVPLEEVARFFAGIGKTLIIEFVPKSDSQVQRLLSSREDIFCNYDQPGFETAFEHCFVINKSCPIKETGRTLYHMQRK